MRPKLLALIYAFLLAVCFISIQASVSARPIVIVVDIALRTAKTIRMITVVKYDGGKMYYHLSKNRKLLTVDCREKEETEKLRLDRIKKKFMAPTDLKGKWPDLGQQLLVVLDRQGHVRFFAKKEKRTYRFWDPNPPSPQGSCFSIPKERPWLPLKERLSYPGDSADKFWRCLDGFKALVHDIKERG